MIQIQLPMSMTATAKLETTSTSSSHKAKKIRPSPTTTTTTKVSDFVVVKSEGKIITTTTTSSETPTCTKIDTSTSDRYWWIHGRAYDLTNFVDRHPGGIESILLGRGRDCTALVESYHAFAAPQVWKVLEKYRTVDDGNEHPKQQHQSKDRPIDRAAESSDGPKQDIFYDTLKQRVTATLHSKGIDPIQDRGASTKRIAYYCFIFTLWIYTGYMHLSASVLGSFLFAITGWLMGALGHDAGHFAASRTAWINEWGVWAMFFICNPILWQHQHTYGHHSYTNEYGQDPDLHHFDLLLRVHKKIRYEAHFRLQKSWLYVTFAYLFVVFGTCFYIPWGVLSSGTLYGIIDWSDQDRPTKRWGMQLAWYMYILIIMVVPVCTHESLSMAFLSIYLHIATLGIVFAFFSQINHLNEPSLESDMESRRLMSTDESSSSILSSSTTVITTLPQPDRHSTGQQSSPTPPSQDNVDRSPRRVQRDPRVIDSWAAAQVETSNNFASQSGLWHILSNGLNHQIEHHLFPGLNHCHLHHIAPIVKATCMEFGVQYKSYDTWTDLMLATLDWFDKLSVDDSIMDDVCRSKKVV